MFTVIHFSSNVVLLIKCVRYPCQASARQLKWLMWCSIRNSKLLGLRPTEITVPTQQRRLEKITVPHPDTRQQHAELVLTASAHERVLWILTCCVPLFQLARIQTDSVAEKLKELYPDVHSEISKDCLSLGCRWALCCFLVFTWCLLSPILKSVITRSQNIVVK